MSRFPNLRLLDFRKIKRAHRKEATELFKSKRGKELLKEIARKTRSNAPNLAAIAAENQAKGLSRIFRFLYLSLAHINIPFFIIVAASSPADLLKIREAIKNATSLQEVERLTAILQSGIIPEEFTSNGSSMTV